MDGGRGGAVQPERDPSPCRSPAGGRSSPAPESTRPAGSRRGRRHNRLGAEVPMAQMAVAVMPIADVGAWQEFIDEISTGARSDAHRAFLRRGGGAREPGFRQEPPWGDPWVLVWDGVAREKVAAHSGSMLQTPATDHE